MDESTLLTPRRGSLAEVFGTFLQLGLTSFGGPVAHLGYFRKELVEKRRWVSEAQFGQLLAICQFLPGPASSQLGFALGLGRAGWAGALAAFVGFTLPSALLLAGFSAALPGLSGPAGLAAIHGLKILAFAVVADAVVGMARKLCPDFRRAVIAGISAVVLLVVRDAGAQLLVVMGGAAAGILWCKGGLGEGGPPPQVLHGRKSGLVLLAVFGALLVAAEWFPWRESGLLPLAAAFYRAGALVFGGGHVVLPLLEESVVSPGWVSREAFLAGYGASQAIPGPMFAFSAYLGTLVPTGHSSWLGALTALVAVFLPGFLLVAGVLPLWRSMAGNARAHQAIAGVNAAVVGLLGAALYDPIFTSAMRGGADLAIGLAGFALAHFRRCPPLGVAVFCVVAAMISGLA